MKKPKSQPVDLFAAGEPPRSQLAVTLFNEPDEEILVLGLVMADAELIEQKLRGSVRKRPCRLSRRSESDHRRGRPDQEALRPAVCTRTGSSPRSTSCRGR